MKTNILLLLFLCSFLIANAQTVQTSIGSPGVTEAFYDHKIDPTDGGTINVGYRNNPPSGNGNDLLIIKKSSTQQIVWQKTIANSGDDIFYKVIVCANGDYVACGHMFVAGVRRAVICRFNSLNGNIIWTARSPSGSGEVFWDVIETTSNNLAVAGAESFTPGLTNSFIVLLNSGGGNIWSRISSVPAADEFRNIQQLPNGNLILGGFYNPSGSFYRATILEVAEANAAILSQTIYPSVPSVPGGLTNNSMLPGSISIRNNNVLIYFQAFQGFGSSSNQCIYTYDQATKNLSGNVYYEPGRSNPTGYSFYPLTENDFLISQSYSTPTPHVAISRVTNGALVSERKINSNVSAIYSNDVLNGYASYSGTFTNTDADAFNLSAPLNIPATFSPCNITDINTLALQASNLTATVQSVTTLSVGNALSSVSLTTQDLSYITDTICAPFSGTSETVQIKIGNSSVTEGFMDVKIDPNDGGTVHAGYIINPATGNSYDLFISKLNSNHQMVWQKTIPNPGDDVFQRVIVCANGDYIACGYTFVGGLRKAIVWRINSLNGNIIWSFTSSNSSAGELFWDAVETSNNNIALVGADSYTTGLTNSFIVLLNPGGSTLWSFVSTTNLADEFRSIAQLPNGNLLVAGFYNPFSVNYYATILELNESNGSIINQNIYNINTSIPGATINSLWSNRIFIRNNIVLIDYLVFEGFTSATNHSIYTYDQATKNLSGNIYYQPGKGGGTGYTFYPLSENDFIISQSYSTPSTYVGVSRITNGSVVFDRKINSNVNAIYNLDIFNTKSAFAGIFNSSGIDAFGMFSSTNISASIFPCDITNINTLTLQASNLPATAQTAISLSASPALSAVSLTPVDPGYIVEDVCGLVIPVTLINFTGTYNDQTSSTLLEWRTATELNSKIFFVERSNDGGRTYNKIGAVNAMGTSNTIVRYDFTDKYPQNGVNLYRLKQVDMDGKFQYSNIVSIEVKRKQPGAYSIYPVPAKGVTFLYTSETGIKLVDISIIDVSGKIIKQQRSYVDKIQPAKLDLANVSPGTYFVKIISGNNEPTSIKITVGY